MDLGRAAERIDSVFQRKPAQPLTPARSQSLPFMFEVAGGDQATPERFILPINPEVFRVSWGTRTSVTYTKASAYQDNIGLGLPSFSIQGTFGYRGTLDPGHKAKTLTGAKKSGFELYQEMEQMLLGFYERFGTYQQNGQPNSNQGELPNLNFFDFTDRYFYEVQIDKFELVRSVQRKFLYQYDIQMTGLRAITAPISEDTLAAQLARLDAVDAVPKRLSFLEGALKLYTSVSNAITNVLNMIDDIKSAVTRVVEAVRAFRNGITKLIRAAASLVKTIVNAIDTITKTIVSIKEIPHELVDACREIRRAMMPLEANTHLFVETNNEAPASSESNQVSSEIMTAPLPTNDPASQAYLMDTPEDTLFAPGTESVREVSVREAQITDSDNIYSLALKNGVDWKQIASLNDLDYPFIAKNRWDLFTPILQQGGSAHAIRPQDTVLQLTNLNAAPGEVLVFTEPGHSGELDAVSATVASANGATVILEEEVGSEFSGAVIVTRHQARRNVLRPGQKAQIPSTAQAVTAITGGSVTDDTYTRLFGIDEELDGAGTQNVGASGDVRSVQGMANLQMQLKHRLDTKRGELAQLGHPGYGSLLPTLIGEIGIPVMYERALFEAEMTILADPRIERLENAKLQVDGTAIYYEADVYPVRQRNATRISLPLAA